MLSNRDLTSHHTEAIAQSSLNGQPFQFRYQDEKEGTSRVLRQLQNLVR